MERRKIQGTDLAVPVAAGVIAIREEEPDEEKEELCPVCDEPFKDITSVAGCSLQPGELDDRHCFFALGAKKLLVIEHEDDEQGEEQMNQDEAVEIEIN